MAQARIILLIAGVTPWVKWELSQIKEQRYQNKLIVLLPPGTAQEHRQRLSILSEVLDVPDADLPPGQETRAIHFFGWRRFPFSSHPGAPGRSVTNCRCLTQSAP